MMKSKKRKIPSINSSSSADIAFLLLIFFLITSSLDPKTGIYRKLKTDSPEDVLKEKMDIQNRNLLTFTIKENNRILYEGDTINLFEVRDLSEAFIDNSNNLDFLPEKEMIDIEGIGAYPASLKHIIALEIDRDAKYETYISVLNELTAAYNHLRNNASNVLFNTSFYNLEEDKQEIIRSIYPLRISEIEIQTQGNGGER